MPCTLSADRKDALNSKFMDVHRTFIEFIIAVKEVVIIQRSLSVGITIISPNVGEFLYWTIGTINGSLQTRLPE